MFGLSRLMGPDLGHRPDTGGRRMSGNPDNRHNPFSPIAIDGAADINRRELPLKVQTIGNFRRKTSPMVELVI